MRLRIELVYYLKQAERIIKFYNEMNEQQQADQTKVFEQKQAEAMTDLKKEFGPTYTKIRSS